MIVRRFTDRFSMRVPRTRLVNPCYRNLNNSVDRGLLQRGNTFVSALVPIGENFPQGSANGTLKLTLLEGARSHPNLRNVPMSRNPRSARVVLGLFCILAAFAIDQLSKTVLVEIIMQPPRVIYVTPFLNITLGYNDGISFGLFAEVFRQRPNLLIALSSGIAILLMMWMLRSKHRIETAALGLVASWHWPAFNMADVAIVTGAMLLLVASFQKSQTSP